MGFPMLFKKKETAPQSYFGLFLQGDGAVGFIFDLQSSNVGLIAKEKVQYTKGWDGIVEDIDELLAILENNTKTKVANCIFFVYSHFVDDKTGDLKEPYRGVMRRIVKELELKPLGYIECHEAVKELMEREEGTPLNCILAEVDARHVNVYVYKGGKIVYKDGCARTDSIAEDIAELIDRKQDHLLLPSRVAVYGSGTLKTEVEALRTYPWRDDVFIQPPKIACLSTAAVLNALSTTFMDQMNAGGAPTASQPNADEDAAAESVDSKGAISSLPQRAASTPAAPAVSGTADIMAAAEADIEFTDPDPRIGKHRGNPPEKGRGRKDDARDEAEKVGFVIGGDVAELPDPPAGSREKSSVSVLRQLRNIPLPRVALPQVNAKGAVIVALLFFVVMGAGAAEYMLHRAAVVVYLPYEKISDTIDLRTSASASATIDARTTSVEVKDSIPTSGSRDVGEKAKGTIVLYNFNDRPVTVAAGTEIYADSLKFIVDSDVQVASRSSRLGSRTAGEKEVTVTASAIGPEFNVAKERQFSIPNQSSQDVYAVAKETFSGGTKKKLRTISKNDLEQLEKRVMEKAKAESDAQLAKSESADGRLLSDLTELKIESSKFSGEVGQEAAEVSVAARVAIRYYIAKGDSLEKEVVKRLTANVPSGYQIDVNQLAYRISGANKDSDTINLNILGEAVAVKKIDTARVVERLRGKSIEEARKVLRAEFDAQDLLVKEQASPLFFMQSWLPFRKGNITVEFATR